METNITIRPMVETDREAVLAMMRVFYASPAVSTNGSEDIFERDITACVGDCPFLAGYILEAAGNMAGYAMVAKSFSTEFGRPCVWVEDLYLAEGFRGMGLGNAFFDFLFATYPDAISRLEVEEENEGAVRLYRKRGYQTLPYMEMVRL